MKFRGSSRSGSIPSDRELRQIEGVPLIRLPRGSDVNEMAVRPEPENEWSRGTSSSSPRQKEHGVEDDSYDQQAAEPCVAGRIHRRVLAERYGVHTQWIVNKARRSAADLKRMTN
jgi:hypothetical protein